MTYPKLWDIGFENVTEAPSYLDYTEFQLTQDRTLFLTSEIDESTIQHINTMIIKWNEEDDKENLVPEMRKPIRLYINSFGGSIYDGLSVVNTIIASKTKVIGICTGYVMSMGLGIFAACHVRVAYPFTSFMYHELSSSATGKAEDIKRATKEYVRLQKMYDSILTTRTGLTQNKLTKVKKSADDWYFGSEEALKYGVIHHLID